MTGLLNSTLTASSRRLYQRAWVVFRQFYAHLYGSTNPPLPLPPTCIPLFISYLSFRKLACSTIKSYLSAISYAHKLKGFNDPTKSFLIDKLLTALSRQQPSDIRLPITRPILHQLIRSLTFSNSSAFQRSLFSAMFLVAFYGLFRIGELASKSTRFARSVVQYSNLTFLFRTGQVKGAKITITEYKHNASRRPFDILLAKRMSLPLFALLQPYISIVISGEIVQGHFFATLIRPSSLFTNSMSHFSSAYLTVVWTVVGTRLIAFALAARAMPLKKVILTRKFVLLVAGNRTHLKFI